jgi:hypothetical protein
MSLPRANSKTWYFRTEETYSRSIGRTYFKRITLRDDPKQPVQDYRLLTVTYGTTAASYLATWCLQQLACDEKEACPVAATVVLQFFCG